MVRHAITLALVLAVSGCGGKQKTGASPTPGTVTAAIEGDPPHFIVRVVRGPDARVLLDLPAPSDEWDAVSADVSEVLGSAGRVFLVQKLSEVGEDEFTRDVEAWIIDAAHDAVLWSGRGSYANSFGECETIDVPEPAIEDGALVVRVAKGVDKLEPDSDRCESVPIQRTEVARIPLR